MAYPDDVLEGLVGKLTGSEERDEGVDDLHLDAGLDDLDWVGVI